MYILYQSALSALAWAISADMLTDGGDACWMDPVSASNVAQLVSALVCIVATCAASFLLGQSQSRDHSR